MFFRAPENQNKQKNFEKSVHWQQIINYFSLESNCISTHVVQSPPDTEGGE